MVDNYGFPGDLGLIDFCRAVHGNEHKIINFFRAVNF